MSGFRRIASASGQRSDPALKARFRRLLTHCGHSIEYAVQQVGTRAAHTPTGVSTFSLLLLAIAIDDDRQRRERQQREKRDRHAKLQRKPPAGPRPF